MKVLVIGGGGREHAIVWKLSQSPKVGSIFCVPGNGGIAELAQCIDLNMNDIEGLVGLAKRERIDLIVVGPEGPLASGLVDRFEKEGMRIFGPRRNGAMMETSKIFAKQLMDRHGVPTAPFRTFSKYEEAKDYVADLKPPYVVKADGLCAGKGAYVIWDGDEGQTVLKELMVNAIHGDSGRNVLVEGFLDGMEASYIVFTDGKTILPMLPSQDHKCLLDGDKGPNTGGMGAYTPIRFLGTGMAKYIDESIMLKTVAALAREGIAYKGALYGGLMISGMTPYVLEFNARFGDPETQPLLFKMESDILPVLLACAEGNLGSIGGLRWREGVSVCVVLASRGYPDAPEKGKSIRGLESLKGDKNVMVFHAATKRSGDTFYTSGGRVFGVTALGATYLDAINKVYDAVSEIHFEGMHFRKDIGRKALDQTGLSAP
jgi:phosphoribosylamine--glycine ligase